MMTSPREGAWFSADDQAALDFWRVYDANMEFVFSETIRAVSSDPEFAPFFAVRAQEGLTPIFKASRALIRRAFEGHWTEYEEYLRGQAAAYADFGISFGGWHRLSRLVYRGVHPALIREYGASPDRLQAALRAMHDFLAQAMITIGSHFIATKEAALRRSEGQLGATLESIGEAVLSADRHGLVTRMNPVAEWLTGWAATDARGRPLAEVFRIADADSDSVVEDHAPRVVCAGDVAGFPARAWLIAASGQLHPISLRAAATYDDAGDPAGVVLVFRDQTHEREAEQVVHESDARKAAMIEASLDAVVKVDDRGLIAEFNRAAEGMFRRSRAQVLGTAFTDLLAPQALGGAFGQAIERVLAGQDLSPSTRRFEVIARHSDGTEFPVDIAIARIRSTRPLGFAAYIRDLTDLKSWQHELQAQKEHAEQAAVQLAASRAELRALAARLREVREEEGHRIAREVHDVVGQALTGIKIDVSWVARRLSARDADPPAPELIERCRSILELVESTTESVKRIATELRPGVLDDLGLVAALEWQSEEFKRRTGIPVRRIIPNRELAVDEQRSICLFRVFQEALTNVARHAAATEVSVSLYASAESVTLEIRDNGVGIHAAATAGQTGLGLIGMRERAELLGGDFHISRLDGTAPRGTVVSVRLPHRKGWSDEDPAGR